MERAVSLQSNELLSSKDAQNLSLFPRASFDRIVRAGIEPGMKFYALPVVQSAPAEVTVGAGAITQDGGIYYRDDEGGVPIDLLPFLPTVTRRIVVITAWGETDDVASEARTFLLDPIKRTTEARLISTESRRVCYFGTKAGTVNSDPQIPAIDSDTIAIAYVVLTPTGIEVINNVASITMAEENRLRSVRDCVTRLDENDAFRARVGSQLETLATTVAGLTNSINGLTTFEFSKRMALDLAVLKKKAGLPDSYSSYHADDFLDQSGTDLTNVNQLCKVEEGIRFADAQIQLAQAVLQNQYDATVKVVNNMMFPAYTATRRISVLGKDSEISLAQYQYQTINTVKRTEARQVIRWGATMNVCTNSAWWNSGQFDPISQVFTRNGETYKAALDLNGMPFAWIDGGNALHVFIRVTQFWVDTVYTDYWDVVTAAAAVNGSTLAQTFLCSQDGYLTNINLFFSRVALTGDVTVMLCNTTDSGSPLVNSVLARTTVAAGDLKTYPTATPVPMTLPLLKKGSRYGIVIITPGNHYVAAVNNSSVLQGTLFVSTDGAFFQGDLTKDLAVEMDFASFVNARTEVTMQPISLPGGIANIEFNNDVLIPDGTTVTHMVQLNGNWVPAGTVDAFIGLPAQLPYKIVYSGTTDLMPAVGIGPRSEIKTTRPRTDFRHITPVITLPTGVNTSKIEVRLRLEWWDPLNHTNTVKILTGAGYTTVKLADVTTQTPTPDQPITAIEKVCVFNLSSPVNTFKIQIEGTTANPLVTYHVAGRKDVEY